MKSECELTLHAQLKFAKIGSKISLFYADKGASLSDERIAELLLLVGLGRFKDTTRAS